MTKNLINILLFLICVLTCLFGGNGPWLLIVAAALLVHVRWTSNWPAEGKLLVTTLIAGSALDSFMLHLGVFDYGQPRTLIPLWQACLWLLLGTTLNHALAGCARPWWCASLLGGCYGPLLYAAISYTGAVKFPLGALPTLILIALLWAIITPVLYGFAEVYRLQYEQSLKARARR